MTLLKLLSTSRRQQKRANKCGGARKTRSNTPPEKQWRGTLFRHSTLQRYQEQTTQVVEQQRCTPAASWHSQCLNNEPRQSWVISGRETQLFLSSIGTQRGRTDSVILDLVDDIIDRHEGLVDLHIGNRKHGMNTSIPKQLKPFHRQRVLLQDANIPSHSHSTVDTICKRTPIFRATHQRIALRKCSECLFGKRGRTQNSRE